MRASKPHRMSIHRRLIASASAALIVVSMVGVTSVSAANNRLAYVGLLPHLRSLRIRPPSGP